MNKFFAIFIPLLLFVSCSSDLNFDQVNDLSLKPTFVANLASFDIQAKQFVSNGTERQFFDVMNFKVFNDVNFTNNLSRTDLFFEFNNTISRACNISLYFLDANEAELYTI